MPPHVSRKRDEPSDTVPPPAKRPKIAVKAKESLFDSVDSPKPSKASAQAARSYLQQLNDQEDSTSSDDEDSDDGIFEDVPGVQTPNGADGTPANAREDEEEEMDWEDAIESRATEQDPHIADVSIAVTEDGAYAHATATDRAASTVRKGPSKRERQVRNGTHCVHVQALVWHNWVRNSWLNDSELHQILLQGLPEGVRIEIDRYRKDMGMTDVVPLSKSKKRRGLKSKGQDGKRGARDWETQNGRADPGTVNRSGGDPTLRLLKLLTAFWRKRFTVVNPGLRKLGYMPIKRLTLEINSWKKNRTDIEKHGERIEDKAALRKLAQTCEGSRDVGSQLFTALLRALGLEARMVANLQPAGIGWGKVEEAKSAKAVTAASTAADAETPTKKAAHSKTPAKKAVPTEKPKEIISLDTDDDSDLSSAPSDFEDDASIVDVTDQFEKKPPKKRYDRDMTFPNYWTEVLSPISNTWVPVDPIVLSAVATNPELVASFEPRGKAADQSKQVMCYTVAHAADGTAKDVTVRYLKKHQLPGRTKGYRIPVEQIKVYNKKGKVLRYEDYDWFKTVLSPFARPHKDRTTADDIEEATDLKPLAAETDKSKVEAESLQWYKQSAEFVLERHLRREEALPSTAKPVRTFLNGKGDKATQEPVYKRSDVVACKTAESWHKEGREIRFGEQPMKLVPMRAVTTMRKREMEEVERTTGEKAKQGLFARDQTDWIIPPPIGADREIPRNAFGNIDVYVPSMVPEGAVHIKLKGAARVCRDLGISHAEAVTGFEFGRRMAVPVITGVVVAKENKQKVIELWRERDAEKKAKEAKKKSEQCLVLWGKMCSGLRIMERMRREYAGTGTEEDINPFVRKAKTSAAEPAAKTADVVVLDEDEDDGGGGFIRSDDELDNTAENTTDIEMGGGFIVEDEEAAQPTDVETPSAADFKPISLRAAHQEQQQFVFDVPTPSPPDAKIKASSSPSPPPKSAKKPRKPAQRKPPAKKAATTRKPRASTASKATPKKAQTGTKSKYFSATESGSSSALSDIDDDTVKEEEDVDEKVPVLDDEDDDDSVEEEVVRPRRTTARTRGKR